MKFLALFALTLVSSPSIAYAQGSPRFDLICTGTKLPLGTGSPKSETRRYTLDLAAKRWCRATECDEALEIERVTPDEITLTRSLPGAALEHRHTISRVTGEYAETVFMQAVGSGSRSTGKCEKGPFSGFPKPKF